MGRRRRRRWREQGSNVLDDVAGNIGSVPTSSSRDSRCMNFTSDVLCASTSSARYRLRKACM